jgi:hypothetical protein
MHDGVNLKKQRVTVERERGRLEKGGHCVKHIAAKGIL